MENIFALDVGTRNLVGVLADYKEEKIIVKNTVSIEHDTRAMEDGQIHDISKVAKTAEVIKEELENKSGLKLNEVAVAVAGRALITQKGRAKLDLDPKEEISEEEILSIELLAIQNSLVELDSKYKEYHCVGYTVSEYDLDGNFIKNPLFQKGNKLEIEILATFLPKVVVDSMFTMTKKIGVEIKSLTLEPIAAISVVIPEDMRKLNLALVDIGAGTSDIAVTKEGKIVGYEMVPMAGDEITEKIENDFLLEFTEAEKVKRVLKETGDKVIYTDILGMEYELEKSDVFTAIDPVTSDLAKKISDKVIELNGKAPQAVILIGGGSLVPGLKDKIAENMGLPAARVALRGTEVIKTLDDLSGMLTTSEFVTPVGIANMAVQGRGFKIISVDINKNTYRVFSFKDKITVMDALVSAKGIGEKDLYSKPGQPLTIKVNGKLQIIKGEMGKPATIKVNKEVRSLEYEIEDGAEIELINHRNGRDAILRAKSLDKINKGVKVTIEKEEIELKSKVLINNEEKEPDYMLQDRDEVIFVDQYYLKDVLKQKNLKSEKLKFYLDENPMEVEIFPFEITRNDEIITENSEIFDGDELVLSSKKEYSLFAKDVVGAELEAQKVSVTVNDTRIDFGEIKPKLTINNKEAGLDDKIRNGDRIHLEVANDNLPIVSDTFKFYNPEELLQNKKGGVLVIELNGKKADFITKLKNNDVLKIYYA